MGRVLILIRLLKYVSIMVPIVEDAAESLGALYKGARVVVLVRLVFFL